MILETKRLYLREMNPEDFDALFRVLGDPETMRHYPYTFDGRHVRDWIERNMNRYRRDGFGLWAVCLKDTGEMIGDCGLTLQDIDGEILPEIGYHIRRDCQRRGYAKEAAKAVRDWAFQNTKYPALYSYCKYTNIPSIKTVESIGMRFDREYPDEVNGTTHVSVIRREDWTGDRLSREQERSGVADRAAGARIETGGTMIELRAITEENFIEAFNLKLAPGQERFVSHPIRSLAQAYVYRNQCQPFGICAEGRMVGYVMVIYDYDVPEYDIWHMMIDQSEQGHGYGSEALDRVIDYIRTKPFGPSDRVALTCHRDNAIARGLYERKGFRATGVEDEDESELAMTVAPIQGG